MRKPIYSLNPSGKIVQNVKGGSIRELTAEEIVEYLNSAITYVDFLIEMYGEGNREFMFPDGVLWVVQDGN